MPRTGVPFRWRMEGSQGASVKENGIWARVRGEVTFIDREGRKVKGFQVKSKAGARAKRQEPAG